MHLVSRDSVPKDNMTTHGTIRQLEYTRMILRLFVNTACYVKTNISVACRSIRYCHEILNITRTLENKCNKCNFLKY